MKHYVSILNHSYMPCQQQIKQQIKQFQKISLTCYPSFYTCIHSTYFKAVSIFIFILSNFSYLYGVLFKGLLVPTSLGLFLPKQFDLCSQLFQFILSAKLVPQQKPFHNWSRDYQFFTLLALSCFKTFFASFKI